MRIHRVKPRQVVRRLKLPIGKAQPKAKYILLNFRVPQDENEYEDKIFMTSDLVEFKTADGLNFLVRGVV